MSCAGGSQSRASRSQRSTSTTNSPAPFAKSFWNRLRYTRKRPSSPTRSCRPSDDPLLGRDVRLAVQALAGTVLSERCAAEGLADLLQQAVFNSRDQYQLLRPTERQELGPLAGLC